MPFKVVPPLYTVWQDMLGRCRNPSFKQWRDYGGRGIDVCERWKKTYKNFVADMGPRPPGTLLDRIDNDKGYSPENCKWSTRKEQQRNQRVTRRATIEGAEYIAADLAEKAGVKTDTIVVRAIQGLSLEQVMAPERRHNFDGLKLGGFASGNSRHRTHCKNGHEFVPPFTYKASNWRICPICGSI